MIELTKYAALKIEELAAEEGWPAIVRVSLQGGGCAGFMNNIEFVLDKKDNDEEIISNGVLIFIDPISLQYLDGTVIDYEDHNMMQVGFKFINPNSTGSCGCGKSFST